MTYVDIRNAVEAEGLILRGGFHPLDEDQVPPVSPDAGCGTLLILGNAGREMWRRFSRSPEFRQESDPLNAFSRRVIESIAEPFAARALFPFDGPPFLPFLRWAQRAEPVWPSPLGPLIHSEYGLWHAYRGALALPDRLELPSRPAAKRPCDVCPDKPCLHACPVDAFDGKSFDVAACIGHIGTPAGEPCFAAGCLARRACPVGTEYAYGPGQAEFHTRAFLRANQQMQRDA
ncbi:MAG: hypothetical protein R3174_00295 [Gammaproteobacteria bacterium]|nr:hypothetical protein [Gammaproteobacteria bacterium]